MNGKLHKQIIENFRRKFEDNCIILMIDAYNSMLSEGRNVREETENNITAQLVGFMKKNPKRSNLQIHISREKYLDSEATFQGNEDADNSPRIDIQYAVWNFGQENEYHMEAKNLAEKNWHKSTTNAFVDASKLRKRYLETGVQNFISGRYPNGCLLGYVVEGSITKLVELFNKNLVNDGKDSEIFIKGDSYDIEYHYFSKHKRSPIPILKHFFLSLS